MRGQTWNETVRFPCESIVYLYTCWCKAVGSRRTRGCQGTRRRTCQTRLTRCRGPQQRPFGVRGGRRVDASPRPVALADHPVPHRRSRRHARSSPREPPSPPWLGEPQELPTRLAPAVSPRPSGVRGGRWVDASPRTVTLVEGIVQPQQEGQRDLVTGNQFREGSAAFVVVFPPHTQRKEARRKSLNNFE